MTRRFTRDELQLAFDTASNFHPPEKVALRVVMDACDVTEVLERIEGRRERSLTHYKSPIPSAALLQFAVLVASYIRELDQESPLPRLEPRYQPTRDDLIVRYVKHLVCRTVLINNCSYIAIALGCLLYDYKPKEIADLGLFDDGTVRHTKKRIKEHMMKRFSWAGLTITEGKRTRIRATLANDYDRTLVHEALKTLTPWHSPHISLAPDESLLETLFKHRSPLTDWDRKHAFLDPECGGLERLITEYNNFYASYRRGFEDPRMKLFIPDFEGLPTPPVNRFKTRKLTENEIMLLNERHKPSGPWAYDEEALLPYVDDCGFGDPVEEICDPLRHLVGDCEGCNATEEDEEDNEHCAPIGWSGTSTNECLSFRPNNGQTYRTVKDTEDRHRDEGRFVRSRGNLMDIWSLAFGSATARYVPTYEDRFLSKIKAAINEELVTSFRKELFLINLIDQPDPLTGYRREFDWYRKTPRYWGVFAHEYYLEHEYSHNATRFSWLDSWRMRHAIARSLERIRRSLYDLNITGGNPPRTVEWWEGDGYCEEKAVNCCWSKPFDLAPKRNVSNSVLWLNQFSGSNIYLAVCIESRILRGRWYRLSVLPISLSRIDETITSSTFSMILDRSVHSPEPEHRTAPGLHGSVTSDCYDSASAQLPGLKRTSNMNAVKAKIRYRSGDLWPELSFLAGKGLFPEHANRGLTPAN